MESSGNSRLLVLMFTDLVNSAALKLQLGVEQYQGLLKRHDEIVAEALRHGPSGRILRDDGDGFFISFESISDAIRASLAFQSLMGNEAWPCSFATRVGLHMGQVERFTNDTTHQERLAATAIDVASRVASLAQGQQILLTRAVFDEGRQLVRSHPLHGNNGSTHALKWVAHGPYMFKGADEPVEVFEIGAEGESPFVVPADTEKARRHIRPGDEELLGWRPAVGLPFPIAPNWIFKEKLGEGGFGEVWLAENIAGRHRVFKFCFDAERLRALKRELVLFRLMKRCLGERRDIAEVKEWSFDKPPHFIEMDYAPHGNLSKWAQEEGGIEKIPLKKRLEIVAKVAEALSAAHSVGILHKDIKPSNILMLQSDSGEWYPRLADFGIGVLTDRERLKQLDITTTFTPALSMSDSSRSGTRMYVPPESLLDRPHTIQGDVYALGVLLYQMAAADLRRPLAEGWDRDIADPFLKRDIGDCVWGDPQMRMKSAQELRDRLCSLERRREEAQAEAREAQRVEELHRTAQRRKRLLRGMSVIVGLLLSLTILIALVSWQLDRIALQAKASAELAKREMTKAQEAEARFRRTAAQAEVDTGVSLRANDPSRALKHFVHALEIESPDQSTLPAHLTRIGLTVAQAPQPVAPWLSGLAATPDPAHVSLKGLVIRRPGDDMGRWTIEKLDGTVLHELRHEAGILEGAFNAGGDLAITAGTDGIAQIWNVGDGKPRGKPMVHQGKVTSVGFSPDGRWALTASEDGTARLWGLAEGMQDRQFVHKSKVLSAEFAKDGTEILTCDEAGVRIWKIEGETSVAEYPLVGGAAYVVQSPDGRALAAIGRSNRNAYILNVQTPGATWRLLRPVGANAICFSPDSRKVLVSCQDRFARIYNVDGTSGELSLGHDDVVLHGAFNADGSRVVTSSRDNTARVWEVKTGRLAAAKLNHRWWVRSACFTPDGKGIVTIVWDWGVLEWRLGSHGPEEVTPPLKMSAMACDQMAWSPRGKRLALVHDRSVTSWDFAKDVSVEVDTGGACQSLAWSDDGERIACAVSGKINVFDAASGKVVGDARECGRVGGQLAANAQAQRVLFAEAAVLEALNRQLGEGDVVLAVNHDLTVAAVRVEKRTVRIIALSGQSPVREFVHKDQIHHAAFSPDGKLLATASHDWSAVVLDVSTGEARFTLRHEGPIYDAAFSPDGNWIATASWDKSARLWSAATGKPGAAPPMVHFNEVRSVEFGADGKMLITASDFYSARVWEARNGQPISSWISHKLGVQRAMFSADGSLCATLDMDGGNGAGRRVRVFELPRQDASQIDRLRTLTSVLNGRRYSEEGVDEPMGREEFTQAVNRLRERR